MHFFYIAIAAITVTLERIIVEQAAVDG